MSKHKILTLNQLVNFFETNKVQSFNAIDSGYELSVQVPGDLKFDENSSQGIMFADIKVCHTQLNRNKSYISEDNMKRAMVSLKQYRPLLGYIHQLDNGEYDFHAHDCEFYIDEDGEENVVYKEKQIGTFTVDEPRLEYDKDMDKTYVIAKVAIPEEYTLAADIIRRKGGTKVSCELVIDSCVYNAKEKYLDITDFYFAGCTCLGAEKDGTEIGEGMLGARLDIEDFSVANNSVCSNIEVNSKLVDTLEKLNTALSGFNINKFSKEGGGNDMDKFEELLKKYSKTKDDITFEIDGLSDEELETAFAEAFDVNMKKEEISISDESKELKNKYSKSIEDLENGNKRLSFELSHSDIRCGLYNLISQFEELDNTWYFISDVYNDHFIMEDWDGASIYGCKYAVDGDNISLTGERYKLYKELLTESEKVELDSMRSNYSELQTELGKYKEAEIDAEKLKVFDCDDYSDYLETDEFEVLINDRSKYSVEELKDKAEIAFAKCVRKSTFSFKNKNKTKKYRHDYVKPEVEVEKKPYGSLFD